MISSEVQRTLVKSPPELWAELSDPSNLARHLEALGEIRITKLRPERSVEWEAEAARGTVELNPSGWGTKVKLTVTRQLAGDQLAPADPLSKPHVARTPDEPAGSAGAGTEGEQPQQASASTEPPNSAGAGTEREEVKTAAAERREADEQALEDFHGQDAEMPAGGEAPSPSPTRSRSRWASLMRLLTARGRRAATTEQPEPGSAEQLSAISPTQEDEGGISGPAMSAERSTRAGTYPSEKQPPVSEASPSEEQPPVSEALALTPDAHAISAELKVLEEKIATQTTEILTAVLDRLGAAHHRPFSRP